MNDTFTVLPSIFKAPTLLSWARLGPPSPYSLQNEGTLVWGALQIHLLWTDSHITVHSCWINQLTRKCRSDSSNNSNDNKMWVHLRCVTIELLPIHRGSRHPGILLSLVHVLSSSMSTCCPFWQNHIPLPPLPAANFISLFPIWLSGFCLGLLPPRSIYRSSPSY